MTKKTKKNVSNASNTKSPQTKNNIESAPLSDLEKQKLKGATLVFVGIALLLFVGTFIFNKIVHPEYIANLLPAGDTIAFLEIDIDPNSAQAKNFFKLFENHPLYQKQNLIQLINNLSGINFEKDLSPWLGRKIAFAFIQEELNPVIFIENKNQNLALEFLKNQKNPNSTNELLSENYDGTVIYSYKSGQNFSFLFLNKYLIIAKDKTSLNLLIDSEAKQKLRYDPNYIKIRNNLPQGGLAFAYANSSKLFSTLIKNKLNNNRGHDLLALSPFLKIFSAGGATIFAEDEKLYIQKFSSIDKQQLQGASYLTFNDKYKGELLDLVNENPILVAGGHDLRKELDRIEGIFKNSLNGGSLVFEGLLEAQKRKYLGENILLKEDIYPLLEEEYLISIENSFEKPEISILLKLKNPQENTMRIEKIALGFTKVSAFFEPQIKNITLPDGTVGQEIVASTEEITRSDELYEGINITTLKMGDLNWGIYYAVVNDVLALNNNLQNIKNIIDRSQGKLETSFKKDPTFMKNSSTILSTADQFFHLKLGSVTEIISSGNEMIKAYLLPFVSVTTGKNFFDDGVSEIYAVEVL